MEDWQQALKRRRGVDGIAEWNRWEPSLEGYRCSAHAGTKYQCPNSATRWKGVLAVCEEH